MKTSQQLLTLAFAITTLATIGAVRPTSCDAGFGHHGHETQGCCRCPQCDHVCKLTAEKVDDEKPCFDVEPKVICIPRVVFPWQKSCCNPCANNGARLRTICVLTTDKYTCPKCEYSWKAEKRSSGCSERGAPSSEATPPAASEEIPAAEPELVPDVPLPEPLAYGAIDAIRNAPVALKFWAPKR